jgi:hypothetical protein
VDLQTNHAIYTGEIKVLMIDGLLSSAQTAYQLIHAG